LIKKLNFEDSLKRLEEITQKLEEGGLSLDDSLKLFEEGIRLSRFCEKKLTDVEQKLEILKSTDLPDIQEEIKEEKIEFEEEINKKPEKKKKEKPISKEEDENSLFQL